MDGEVEDVSETGSEERAEGVAQGQTHEEAAVNEDEEMMQDALESEVFDRLLREAQRLPTSELELRLSAIKQVIECRTEGEDGTSEKADMEEDGGCGGNGEGDAELQGACRGKKRQKVTPAVIQRRVAAKERMIKKYFWEMESKLGVSCWCYGLVTPGGKLLVGGAESITDWFARKYRAEVLNVHLSRRGEMQQALSRFSGIDLLLLLDMLSCKQLSSLASGWLKRCEPSLKDFPLDKSKGIPPWWPDDVTFQQVASLRKPSQIKVLLAAAECICRNNAQSAAELKLEKAISTSRILCNESLEVRAILHTVVKQAMTRWRQAEPEDGAAEERGAGHSQPRGSAANAEAGQGSEAGARADGEESRARADLADADEGLLAGLGTRQRRRRACDIAHRPFKCPHPGCGHAYVNKSGLDKHAKAKHPVDASGAPDTAHATKPTAPPPGSPHGPAAASVAKTGSTRPPAPVPSPPPAVHPHEAKADANEAPSFQPARVPGAAPEVPAAETAPPSQAAAHGAPGSSQAGDLPGPLPDLGATSAASTRCPSTGGEALPMRSAPPATTDTTTTKPFSPLAKAQAAKPAAGIRRKRSPRTPLISPPLPSVSTPLQPLNENSDGGNARKRKRDVPTDFDTAEEYIEHMMGPRRGLQVLSWATGKRRSALKEKWYASVPAHMANRISIEALEAKPCKRLYRSVGSDVFELLLSGPSSSPEEYKNLNDVALEGLVAFAKASNISYAGVRQYLLRRIIQRALELEILRDNNLLPENGDHLR